MYTESGKGSMECFRIPLGDVFKVGDGPWVMVVPVISPGMIAYTSVTQVVLPDEIQRWLDARIRSAERPETGIERYFRELEEGE